MRRGPLVTGVIVAAALAILAVMFVMPRGARVNDLRAELDSANAALTGLQGTLAELRAASDDQGALADLRAVANLVPSSADLPGYIALLEDAARTAGVDLNRIEPGQPGSGASSASVIPVTIGVEGSYFQLSRFLFELEHLPRLSKVAGVNVVKADTVLAMTVSAEIYTTDASVGPGAAADGA